MTPAAYHKYTHSTDEQSKAQGLGRRGTFSATAGLNWRLFGGGPPRTAQGAAILIGVAWRGDKRGSLEAESGGLWKGARGRALAVGG